jgi:hypothetical protein
MLQALVAIVLTSAALPAPTNAEEAVALAVGSAASPPGENLLDGTWVGTEKCVEHCCFASNKCQGSVPATLTIKGGNGTYNQGSVNYVVSTEYRGNFMSGHVVSDVDGGTPHGTYILQANNTQVR